ncbi:SPP1 family predicted phage head-tail adaptor [Staphylococcus caledonicus]|uniref:phage head closure protein n=1 Tax=Staphylococcus TaxID=1279 RepID=UPI000D1F935C|nr:MULTISPECIES: phage head closure protein [Staphylococcus]HAR6061629.1 phage head closure protein [Staphylococcus pseudintermedius]MCE4955257.1 phage head closure protein [Staphylococcus haemolyticus]PTK51919.1 head-tail adaptor protein [Staphylococcus haemolyticus]WKU12942.1 phage head closure protein [Staphylococcus devriesei]WKU13878.1 phage head closure protein [Staphylococcus devriesei]
MAYFFDNVISIIDYEQGVNDEGTYTEIEKVIANPWADIKTMRGREFESMGFTVNAQPIRFVIRYRKGILPDQKVKYDGEIYNIESVTNDDGRNYTLTIFATKVK